MKRVFSIPAIHVGVMLLVSGVFFGCESQLEAPAEMTLQTRSAVEVLPAGARFVGMMDLQAMQQNPSFRPFDGAPLTGELGARIESLLEATGFDPREDVRQVYVASDRLDGPSTPSFVAYADFDRDRLQTYVEEHFGDRFERSAYQGLTVYTAHEAEHPITFALATEEMLVASPDRAAVHAMLDRLEGRGGALKDDAATMEMIALASGGSAWFVARGVGDAFAHARHAADDGPHEAAEQNIVQIGKALQDVAVRLTMQGDGAAGSVILYTRPGVSADDVADLTRGVVAAMKATAGEDPKKLEMLDGVRVQSRSGQVQVSFHVEQALLGDG